MQSVIQLFLRASTCNRHELRGNEYKAHVAPNQTHVINNKVELRAILLITFLSFRSLFTYLITNENYIRVIE